MTKISSEFENPLLNEVVGVSPQSTWFSSLFPLAIPARTENASRFERLNGYVL